MVGPDHRANRRLCNDKVMYVGFENELEAYYLCGLLYLRSDPLAHHLQHDGDPDLHFRHQAFATPPFPPRMPPIAAIAESCRQGHAAAAAGQFTAAARPLEASNQAVAKIYGLTDNDRQTLRRNSNGSFPHGDSHGSS